MRPALPLLAPVLGESVREDLHREPLLSTEDALGEAALEEALDHGVHLGGSTVLASHGSGW